MEREGAGQAEEKEVKIPERQNRKTENGDTNPLKTPPKRAKGKSKAGSALSAEEGAKLATTQFWVTKDCGMTI